MYPHFFFFSGVSYKDIAKEFWLQLFSQLAWQNTNLFDECKEMQGIPI
jgi:hypothetical protein